MALILVKHGVHHPIARLKLESANESDLVVLMQDGVFWAVTDELKEVKADVYVLQDDWCTRGYRTEATSLPLISYPDFVDIIVQEEKSIA